MEAKEIERNGRDLSKLTTSNEPAPSALPILFDLRKNVRASRDLLRSTKIGIIVNKLRQNKDPEVARQAAELVNKWKRDVEPESAAAAGKGKDGRGTPVTGGLGAPPPSGSQQSQKKDGTDEGANGDATTTLKKPSVPPEQRSTKTDGVDINVTGSAVRDNCLKLMYDGLAFMSEDSTSHVLSIATAVEASAHDHLPPKGSEAVSDAYKSKIRSLFQNLKNKSNPALRTNVLSGAISPDTFVRMTAEELKSPERRAEDQKMAKENMDMAMTPQQELSFSDSLQCPKCKKKMVSYTQAQTRSADEPMTTFCHCVNCNNRWKFS